jgi:hypothetical protein
VRLRDLETAKFHGAKAAALAPDFTVARFAAMEPLRDPIDMANWKDALLLAGIPA